MGRTCSEYLRSLGIFYFAWLASAQTLTEPRLWQYGCWKTANLTRTFWKDLDFNSPGACYDFCHQFKNQTTEYIALQNDNCACLASLNDTIVANHGHGCTQTCSGNNYQFCGHDIQGISSVYRIEENAMSDNHLCTTMDCTETDPSLIIMDKNCSEKKGLFLFCGRVPTISSCLGMQPGTWTDLQSTCTANSEAEYKHACDQYCKINHRSWVGGFGKYAPNACIHLNNITSGQVVMTGTQTGDTAVYACATGHVIPANVTRVCLTNGTWTGAEPYCSGTKTDIQTTSSSIGTFSTKPPVQTTSSSIGTSTKKKDAETASSALGTAAIIGIALSIFLVIVTATIGTCFCWKRKLACFKETRVEDSEVNGNGMAPASTGIIG